MLRFFDEKKSGIWAILIDIYSKSMDQSMIYTINVLPASRYPLFFLSCINADHKKNHIWTILWNSNIKAELYINC